MEHGEANAVCAMCVPEPLMEKVLRFLSLEFSITSVESIRLASPNPTLSARLTSRVSLRLAASIFSCIPLTSPSSRLTG